MNLHTWKLVHQKEISNGTIIVFDVFEDGVVDITIGQQTFKSVFQNLNTQLWDNIFPFVYLDKPEDSIEVLTGCS